MNRLKQAMILALPMAAVVLYFALWRPGKPDRAAILAQSQAIGHELVTQTNSPHLTFPGALFQRRLAEFLSAPAKVEAVLYGDEPRPAAQGKASSRVFLMNQKGRPPGPAPEAGGRAGAFSAGGVVDPQLSSDGRDGLKRADQTFALFFVVSFVGYLRCSADFDKG